MCTVTVVLDQSATDSFNISEYTRQQLGIYYWGHYSEAHLKNLVIRVEHSSCQACIQHQHLSYKLVTVGKELSPNTSDHRSVKDLLTGGRNKEGQGKGEKQMRRM